jgi:secreted trypsin-like serine protease
MPSRLAALLLAAATAVPAQAADSARSPADQVRAIDKAAINAAAPAAETGTRVLGGQPAADGSWPWQVALILADKAPFEGQFCGGSLITDRWVLTAAHCARMDDGSGTLADIRPGQVRVLAGSNRLDGPEADIIDVVEVHVHPGYDPDIFDNDIALLKLARPPQTPRATQVTVAEPDLGDVIEKNEWQAIVTGWGRLETGQFPVDLRESRIQVFDRDACNASIFEGRSQTAMDRFVEAANLVGASQEAAEEAWNRLVSSARPVLTENMVCSGSVEGGRGACNGDSGGPLVVPMPGGKGFVQVGVVSWGFSAEGGEGCEMTAQFSAYTRVANYLDWIRGFVDAP